MEKIVFLGDSITDAFHNLGVNERGLGNGYVSIVAGYMEAQEERVKILNRGHDGFTTQGVFRMLGRDCIVHQPDVVSILVGCNDVGVFMNTGKSLEEQDFAGNYEKILCEIKEYTNASVICMTPFIFPCPQEYAAWIPYIKRVGETIEELARKYHTQCILLHDRLTAEAEKHGYGKITTDGIHLTVEGAEIVAGEWQQAWKRYKEGR